jgi:predicted Zn-dependent protease
VELIFGLSRHKKVSTTKLKLRAKHHTTMPIPHFSFTVPGLKRPCAAWALGLSLGLLSPLALQAQTAQQNQSNQLPALGDGSDMSTRVERRLGDRIARELYRDPDYLDDALLAEYVQGIWQPLLAAARARGDLSPELSENFAWEILLGRDRTVNAFALPGGYLGLHLGLLAVVNSRDELASVLGHELSHVTQRHISRLLSKQGQQSPWMIGAMILGALAASKNTQVGSALIVGGQAVAVQNQLNFSRDMEREADRLGLGVMTQAGFEAQGFVAMFDKLQQAARHNDTGAYPYLRSHPLTTERIADMQSRLAFLPATPASAPSLEHSLMSMRARVLSNPGVDALRGLVQEAEGPRLATLPEGKQATVLYGAALAHTRLRDFAGARAQLARLAPLVQSDAAASRVVRLLDAEQALVSGDAARTLRLLKLDSLADAALDRPTLLLLAQAVLQSSPQDPTQAKVQVAAVAQALQAWVQTHVHDARAWQLLAQAYVTQGQGLRAIRADAEAQVAVLNLDAALDRYKAAQQLVRQGAARQAGDNIEASIIDTRRRQLESTLKEQALER